MNSLGNSKSKRDHVEDSETQKTGQLKLSSQGKKKEKEK